MPRRLSLAAALGLAALSAAAQDADVHGRGARCVEGDCSNGFGTVMNALGHQYTGAWRNGGFIAGDYKVRWYAAPDKTYTVTMGGDGLPLRGTQVRGFPDALFNNGIYTGDYGRVFNPFTGQQMASLRSGRYQDPKGILYEGEFDYLPAKSVFGNSTAAGFFIFQGTRTDPLLDEVTQGLYISDETIAGADIRFSRARPDYIVKLRQDYQFSREQQAREQADEARSRETWGALLNIVVATAVTRAGAKHLAGGSDRSVFQALGRAMTGAESPEQALQGLAGQFQRQAGAHPALGGLLAGARDPQDVGRIAGQFAKEQTRTMSQREYAQVVAQALQKAAAPGATQAGPVHAAQARGERGAGTTATAPATTPAPARPAQKSRTPSGCMSYSTLIPPGQHVCFAQSLLQYRCSHYRGEEGLSFVQRLSLRSSLREKDLCYHVDPTNQRPPVNQLLE